MFNIKCPNCSELMEFEFSTNAFTKISCDYHSHNQCSIDLVNDSNKWIICGYSLYLKNEFYLGGSNRTYFTQSESKTILAKIHPRSIPYSSLLISVDFVPIYLDSDVNEQIIKIFNNLKELSLFV